MMSLIRRKMMNREAVVEAGRYFTVLILLLFLQTLRAQTLVLGRPVNFEKPVDLFEQKGRLAELYSNESRKSTENA